MPRKAQPHNQTPSKRGANRATVTVLPTANNGGKPTMSFTATPVDRATMPQPGRRGGRTSNMPAIEAFLRSITEPGVTYQMGSPDADGGHPVNRVTQVRKAAGDTYKVETSPIETGKRYLVFVTLANGTK